MKDFIGCKHIKAKPMTRGDYNALRGWEVPANENPADAGFLVEYVDGGAANHPDFQGYISWSPKDVFERAYFPTTGMTYLQAMAALLAGLSVQRAAWVGNSVGRVRNQRVVPDPRYFLAINYEVNTDAGVRTHEVHSAESLLATDWQVCHPHVDTKPLEDAAEKLQEVRDNLAQGRATIDTDILRKDEKA